MPPSAPPPPQPAPPQPSMMQKVIQYLGKAEVQDNVKRQVLDPLLNHVMKRVFPYIILTCVLFVLLLLVVLLTLGIIIFQLRGATAPVGGTVAALSGT